MDRMGKAGRYLAKPRQGLLAARSVSRHKDDPGAHFREFSGGGFSNARSASRNDNRLALQENSPSPCMNLYPMALYRSVRVRAASDLATTHDRMAKAD
jgi:hypothetical protein